MIALLNQWHGVAGSAPSNTHLFIMKGAGGKAFCAGKPLWLGALISTTMAVLPFFLPHCLFI
jgi:hypothetical protein